jgi:hypothetical protein
MPFRSREQDGLWKRFHVARKCALPHSPANRKPANQRANRTNTNPCGDNGRICSVSLPDSVPMTRSGTQARRSGDAIMNQQAITIFSKQQKDEIYGICRTRSLGPHFQAHEDPWFRLHRHAEHVLRAGASVRNLHPASGFHRAAPFRTVGDANHSCGSGEPHLKPITGSLPLRKPARPASVRT